MTSPKLLFSCAALLVAGALPAQAVTYYADAVNGSDTANSGLTPSTALRSMSKASTLMKKGDTLIVLPGVYNIAVEGSFPVQWGDTSTDQTGISIIAAEGPSKTFIDGGNTYKGIGMVRFRENAPGARISGFTFRNMADDFWSCGIRLGSSSGNQFRCVDVEVDNNVFDSSLSRAFVVFGGSAGTRQATGMRIHNNLIVNLHSNRRSVEIDGDGDNWFYNNTVIHTTNTTDRAAVYMQSIVASAPAKANIFNNIVIGAGTGAWGIEMGTNGGAATVQYNNSFGNVVNYRGFTPHASNLSVDPQFTSATDFHLKSTSPLLDKGTANLPLIRHDPDYFPHLYPSGPNQPRLPDIGAYERHPVDLSITAPPKIGGTAAFAFTGGAGLGGLLVGLNEVSVVIPGTPFGVILADTLLHLGTTSSPGTLSLPVPNLPGAEGLRLVFQGIYSGGGQLELLNVRHTYVRK